MGEFIASKWGELVVSVINRPTWGELVGRVEVTGYRALKGGATVLKVGPASEKIFLTPTIRLPGGYRNKYGCTKFAHRNGIMN